MKLRELLDDLKPLSAKDRLFIEFDGGLYEISGFYRRYCSREHQIVLVTGREEEIDENSKEYFDD